MWVRMHPFKTSKQTLQTMAEFQLAQHLLALCTTMQVSSYTVRNPANMHASHAAATTVEA
jgi:hypothetical protein